MEELLDWMEYIEDIRQTTYQISKRSTRTL